MEPVQEKQLHIIVDNCAIHKHENIKKWLSKNKRVQLHFTPTSLSWLNLVERFFGILTEKQLSRGIFLSVKDLETKIMEYLDMHNENPKPSLCVRVVVVFYNIYRAAMRSHDKALN